MLQLVFTNEYETVSSANCINDEKNSTVTVWIWTDEKKVLKHGKWEQIISLLSTINAIHDIFWVVLN